MLKNLFLSALVAIPLNSAKDWQILEYSGLDANKVSFVETGMNVVVKKSASPIIYPLKKKMMVKKIKVRAKNKGLVTFKKDRVQGDKKADDYIFRLGLVVPGEQTLSGLKKMIAPSWVKKLFSLAPKGEGVDHIYFLSVGQLDDHLGRIREHPLTDLMKEEVVLVHKTDGEFMFTKEFSEPKEVAAIWISIDGDDTDSSFEVEVQEITLE